METSEIERLVEELETRVDRLRALYDQYFMGIERLEPLVPRKDVERRLQTLRREQIRNTALRFKFQTVLQRYNTYQTYWMRIARQIEEGTYRRDVLRANARFGAGLGDARTSTPPPPDTPPPPSRRAEDDDAIEVTIDVDLEGIAEDPFPKPPSFAPRRSVAPPPPLPAQAAQAAPSLPPRPPLPSMRIAPRPSQPDAQERAAPSPMPMRPPAATLPSFPPGEVPMRTVAPPRPSIRPIARSAPSLPSPPATASLSDERLRELYGQLVEARRQRNEPASSLTFEAMAARLRTSAEALRQRHGASRAIDFEVVVEGGKTVVRPIVR